MTLTKENVNYIQAAFQKLTTKDDLLELLNYTKRIKYGEKTVDFQMKQLNYHMLSNANKSRYTSFTIRKKSGGERVIHAPNKGLKVLLSFLNIILQCVFEPHKAAFGFVSGKSIADNAAMHVGNYYVYNTDLKDFFPSINKARVYACLKNRPFNLDKEPQKLRLANYIAFLCCAEMEIERDNKKVKEFVLPQGAPTSPVITNVVCQRLDFLLTGVAKRFGLKYSRYADDITFSSLHNVYQKDSEFLEKLKRIITEQGFEIKQSKTRLQRQGYQQAVTGLLVNEKVNVQKRYTRQIRKWLYLWETYGYEKAAAIFLKEYVADKGYVKKGKPDMQHVIDGKLNYLKMVKGEHDSVYVKMKAQFDSYKQKKPIVIEDISPVVSNKSDVDAILEALVNNDLETAMSMFK